VKKSNSPSLFGPVWVWPVRARPALTTQLQWSRRLDHKVTTSCENRFRFNIVEVCKIVGLGKKWKTEFNTRAI